MLGELVYNLVDNAVKYNREGGFVTVSLEEAADGGRSLTVADTGVGIDPADQPHVFERFFRGDRRGRHGAGAVHRQARGAGAWREGVARKRSGQGHQHPRGFSRLGQTDKSRLLWRRLLS